MRSHTMSLAPEPIRRKYGVLEPYLTASCVFCFTAIMLAPLMFIETYLMYRGIKTRNKRYFNRARNCANIVMVLGIIVSIIMIITVGMFLVCYW